VQSTDGLRNRIQAGSVVRTVPRVAFVTPLSSLADFYVVFLPTRSFTSYLLEACVRLSVPDVGCLVLERGRALTGPQLTNHRLGGEM
jgi:hypothetical protein